MKVIFEDILWRNTDDETTLLEEFNIRHNHIGNLKTISYNFATTECKIYGDENTFGCSVYAFSHTTKGLERTTLLFATFAGSVGEITIFPDGKVAVIVENYINAPQWAIERQKRYCL